LIVTAVLSYQTRPQIARGVPSVRDDHLGTGPNIFVGPELLVVVDQRQRAVCPGIFSREQPIQRVIRERQVAGLVFSIVDAPDVPADSSAQMEIATQTNRGFSNVVSALALTRLRPVCPRFFDFISRFLGRFFNYAVCDDLHQLAAIQFT
jgi:hypothetical protein